MIEMAVGNLPTRHECESSLQHVRDALYVLSGKWKLPVILSLMQSSKRFNELQHELDGISSKVLAKELKTLELNEFLRRIVVQGSPSTVIYEATEYSHTLRNVLAELSEWGKQHREVIRRSMRKVEA